MKKALLTSNNTSIKQANKRKYIKGGAAKYNFKIDKNTNYDNIIKIIAENTNTNDNEKTDITYFTKSTKSTNSGNLIVNDIKEFKINEDTLFNIITANLTETNYYQGKITNYEDFLDNIKSFDTCIFVKLSNNNIYIFLKVEKKSSNIALDKFDKYQSNADNISQIDATMIKKFKSLGLDINFVNKFVAGVKGFVEGKKNEINEIIEQKAADQKAAAVKIQAVARGRAVRQNVANNKAADVLKDIKRKGGVNNSNKLSKKINTNKILNNLILKLSKIHNVKKPTKPKPKATKPTKPKTKATKPTKPKTKATKPTKLVKPKVTKPKATKKI
jgi:hypothetical protein